MRVALVLLAVSLVACRDVEIVDGAGGSSSTSTTSKSATAATGSTSGTSMQKICGGKTGQLCAADEYCDWADDSCGTADQTGLCVPRPTGCTADCPGVCACDGSFYCNACGAAGLGIDVSTSTACLPDNAEYTAEIWAGGLDHLIVKKADYQRDLCFQVFLDSPMMVQDPYAIVAPQSYAASHAVAIQGAAFCYQDVGPGPLSQQASSGKGVVDWILAPGAYYPCELDMDIVLQFEGSASWLNPTEHLFAKGVKVENGCQ